MKKDRVVKLTKEQAEKMVKEYLESDLSAREVADKYGVAPATVIYHANKVREKARKKEGG